MATQLPKKVFIRWNEDLDEPFLQADTRAGMLLTVDEIGESVQAGEYELKKEVKIQNKTEVV